MLVKNYDRLIQNGRTPLLQKKRKDILDMFTAAFEAVDPYLVVEKVIQDHQLVFPSETIDLTSFDHLYLVGFGKASIGMARAVCDAIPVTRGVVITNDPSAQFSHPSIEVFVGGHPLPNEASITGAEQILNLLHQAGENDAILTLISGGGSALFCQPRIPLTDLIQTTHLLLRSGATIQEINTVRKHLSLVKGGQMVGHTKSTIFSLIISDIVGDPLSSIASGTTVPDSTTFSDAQTILHHYDVWSRIPESVRSVITEGIARKIPETPKPTDPMFDRVFNYIIANNTLACEAAAHKAKELGYIPIIITTSLTGEARMMGRFLINKARQSLTREHAVFISGGETTVTVKGSGRGGRNQELVLGGIEEIADSSMVVASLATDGLDGTSDAAGALADGYTLLRAHEKQLFPERFLTENNSSEFFTQLHDAILTGPTGTNVMDVQIITP